MNKPLNYWASRVGAWKCWFSLRQRAAKPEVRQKFCALTHGTLPQKPPIMPWQQLVMQLAEILSFENNQTPHCGGVFFFKWELPFESFFPPGMLKSKEKKDQPFKWFFYKSKFYNWPHLYLKDLSFRKHLRLSYDKETVHTEFKLKNTLPLWIELESSVLWSYSWFSVFDVKAQLS